ncbi:MAG: acyl-CoA dehydrogenase family protein, partial [Terricaulis silvestris]
LLTPITKAWCTDMGVEVASLGVQVHGGMGFVEEGGAAQFYRDARIAPIYEGANGIQAIDLVGRKVQNDQGVAMRALIAEARKAAHGPLMSAAVDALAEATDYIVAASREDAQAGAAAYLTLAGDVAGAMLLMQGLAREANDEQAALLSHFAQTHLALAPARLAAIELGAGALKDSRLKDFA